MKKLILTLIILFSFSLSSESWTGLTDREQKQKEIQDKINYLYQNYPPNETGWMHKISKSIN